MSIDAKLVSVMQACHSMSKDAENPTAGYKYLSAEKLIGKVNEQFTKHGLSVQTLADLKKFLPIETTIGTREITAVVKVTILVTDSETGDSRKFEGLGQGIDAGDKAVMKATTAATKYAYISGLCIAMTDDPETDLNTSAYKKNPAGMNNIAGKCDKCGKAIDQRVIDYSTRNFGRRLCMDCQQKLRAVNGSENG